MNISQHTIFPIRCKLGYFKFDGTLGSVNPNSSMTHWFPISTIGLRLFYTNPNAVSDYGDTRGYRELISPDSSTSLSEHIVLTFNTNVLDSTTPTVPSRPFTYILY